MNKIINVSIDKYLNISKFNRMKNEIVFVGPEGFGKSHSILNYIVLGNRTKRKIRIK